jgi:hypothetical protein
MDDIRREKTRMLIRVLEAIQKEVSDIESDEDSAFQGRSAPSKSTAMGEDSKDAADCLSEASDSLGWAINWMKSAVGDDSDPLPKPQTP